MTQATTTARSVRAIPDGYTSVTPSLTVRNAAGAIEFYSRAFGARELGRMASPEGLIWHAELQVGDTRLMLNDEFPEMGGHAPESLGGTPVSLHLYVEDVDAVFQRAIDAGATVIQPLEDAFWGDRYGKVKDPFGHEWGLATHIEDVSEEDMQQRAQAAAATAG